MKPRISIVMPVFNATTTLDDCIQSLQAQTEENWELIAVNDGSTDRTATILNDYAKADARIRVIHFESNQGIVAALNTGIEHTEAEYIARMDADDESTYFRLAAQAHLLDIHPETGLVSGLVIYGGDAEVQQGYKLHVDWMNSVFSHDEISLSRFIESPLAHPSVMFRKALIRESGGYKHGDFPEDYELWLRWLQAGVRMQKLHYPVIVWNDPVHRASRTDVRYRTDAFYAIKMRYLASWLQEQLPAGKPLWMWGAGRITRRRFDPLFAQGIIPARFVDIDRDKAGNTIGGIPVVLPETIPPPGEVFVLGCVSSRGARELIRNFLNEKGYKEGKDYLLAA